MNCFQSELSRRVSPWAYGTDRGLQHTCSRYLVSQNQRYEIEGDSLGWSRWEEEPDLLRAGEHECFHRRKGGIDDFSWACSVLHFIVDADSLPQLAAGRDLGRDWDREAPETTGSFTTRKRHQRLRTLRLTWQWLMATWTCWWCNTPPLTSSTRPHSGQGPQHLQMTTNGKTVRKIWLDKHEIFSMIYDEEICQVTVREHVERRHQLISKVINNQTFTSTGWPFNNGACTFHERIIFLKLHILFTITQFPPHSRDAPILGGLVPDPDNLNWPWAPGGQWC